MKKTTSFCLFILFLVTVNAPVNAETFGCEAVLVPHEVHYDRDTTLKLSKLKILNRKTFNQQRRGITTGGGIGYAGVNLSSYSSFEDFNVFRQSEFSKYKYDFNVEDAVNYLARYLPADAYSAFVDCLRAQSQSKIGVHAFARAIEDDYISIDLYYSPPPKGKGLRITQFTYKGGKLLTNKPKALEPNTYLPLDFERTQGEPFRMVVSAEGFQPARINIPLPIQPPKALRKKWEISGFRVPLDITVHQATQGDLTGRDGIWVGVQGHSLRIEAIKIEVKPGERVPGLEIGYMCHQETFADLPKPEGSYLKEGEWCGDERHNKITQGVGVKLSGPQASNFFVRLYCHIEGSPTNFGADEFGYCGTRGQHRRMESVKLEIVRK